MCSEPQRQHSTSSALQLLSQCFPWLPGVQLGWWLVAQGGSRWVAGAHCQLTSIGFREVKWWDARGEVFLGRFFWNKPIGIKIWILSKVLHFCMFSISFKISRWNNSSAVFCSSWGDFAATCGTSPQMQARQNFLGFLPCGKKMRKTTKCNDNFIQFSQRIGWI